jgi:hypothetical protein
LFSVSLGFDSPSCCFVVATLSTIYIYSSLVDRSCCLYSRSSPPPRSSPPCPPRPRVKRKRPTPFGECRMSGLSAVIFGGNDMQRRRTELGVQSRANVQAGRYVSHSGSAGCYARTRLRPRTSTTSSTFILFLSLFLILTLDKGVAASSESPKRASSHRAKANVSVAACCTHPLDVMRVYVYGYCMLAELALTDLQAYADRKDKYGPRHGCQGCSGA